MKFIIVLETQVKTSNWIRALLLSLVALTATCNGQEKPNLRTVREPETIQFQSKLIGATLPYAVILPTDYSRARSTRYPVLYLLHGLTGHYTDWIRRTNVADYAAQYRLIVVMPEGNDGWYTDSAGVPNDKYESYILQELIPDVQQRFRTIEARYARAIAGLSMGGYGSIKFGLKHPTTFAFAGSMSGAFGVTRDTENDSGWKGLTQVFGPMSSETRRGNDLFEIIQNLSPGNAGGLPYFYFDCGTEDSPRIFNSNRELSELMLRKRSLMSTGSCLEIIPGPIGISKYGRF